MRVETLEEALDELDLALRGTDLMAGGLHPKLSATSQLTRDLIGQQAETTAQLRSVRRRALPKLLLYQALKRIENALGVRGARSD